MTDFLIRQAERGDIEQITGLFNLVFEASATSPYMRWLLSDPYHQGNLNSLVALSDDRIVGQIGYVKAKYLRGTERISGVHPISLCVHPDSRRSGIGRELFKRASLMGDVSIIYEGGPEGWPLYPMLGYKEAGQAYHYRTSVRLPGIAGFCSERAIKGFPRALASSLRDKAARAGRTRVKDPRISFGPYSAAEWAGCTPADGLLTNCPDLETIGWFQECPQLESHVHTVRQGETALGTLFLYVHRYGTHSTGRIHHLPNMGDDHTGWVTVLTHAERLLAGLGCSMVTICATHRGLRGGLDALGWRHIDQRRIWIVDHQGLLNERQWHLTYLEGDHGFRGV
ncbi:MAG: GNAT family N-acetyltransferase [bacterium]